MPETRKRRRWQEGRRSRRSRSNRRWSCPPNPRFPCRPLSRATGQPPAKRSRPTSKTSSATRGSRSSIAKADPTPSRALRSTFAPADPYCSPRADPSRRKRLSSFRNPVKPFASRSISKNAASVPVPPQAQTPLVPMPSYQYNFVVLAKSPSRYSYIKTIDSVKSPFNGESDEDNTEEAVHYIVVELTADQLALLPDNPLTWTSVAYVLWDQIDPGEPFPAEQKKALVDWIHWGGQLIISGPDSLDLLKGSFLDPYLPATSGGTRKFDAADKDLAELSASWMISTKTVPGVPLHPTAAVVGHPTQSASPARRACRTPAVCSSNARSAAAASSFPPSNFPSATSSTGAPASKASSTPACSAGQPRKYYPGHFGGATVTWADDSLRERRLDASLNTNLYYFARDLGVATSYHHEPSADARAQLMQQLPPAARARMGRQARPTDARRIPPARQSGRRRRLERLQRHRQRRPPVAARGRRRGSARRRFRRPLPRRHTWSHSCRSIGSCFAPSAASNGPGSPRRSSPSSALGSSCNAPASTSASSARKPKSASSNNNRIMPALISPVTPRSTRRSRPPTISSSAT